MADFSKKEGGAARPPRGRARRSQSKRAASRKRDVAADFSRWPECAEHAFFKAKGVPVPSGLRMMGSDFAVPVHAPGGEMISWQIISPRGDKRFKNGNRLGKRYFFKLDGPERDRIYIAEGLAAACSVYEATGRKHAVLYAFSKSNADDLAEGFLLEGSPKQKIVLCLDNEGEKTHRPRLQHERLIVLCPEAKGDFNERQGNGKERKKLLKLAPVYETKAARPVADRPKQAPPLAKGEALPVAERGEARFSFYAALFQEKRAWTAGEIVRRAAKGKGAGGRGLSRAQVFRNLRELEAKGCLKKTGNRPLTEYRAVEGFSARRAESAARRDDSPETIEIEGGPPENEAVAAA